MYRKAAGLALAGALLGGAVACSGDSSAQPDRKSVSKPVRVTLAAAIERAAAKNEKLTSLSYRMTGRIPGQGSLEARAAIGFKPAVMRMSMTQKDAAQSGDVEMRLVGGAFYVNGGKEAAAELDGKSWIKFDLSAMGKGAGGQDPFAGVGRADRNPAEDSESLTAAKDLRKVGPQRVDGVATTHYTGTVQLATMRQSLVNEDAATRKRREKSLEEYEKMGVSSLTMDMWIDGNDQTKQFRIRAKGAKGPLDLTMTFLDYNKPVVVTAPPASETADLAEMFKGAGQEP
ncbi:DUF1396 domain-containing protein [Streptomyces sp. NBC_01167]|uniref:DUF1396 domain-containing protein n=1 Tax=Streptomyces sp. NBC_01167 TaxID=2903756 RepID=UPI00386CC413|nr:DUF1396 domain-containing protein [Streptomyces sp. NBC_01167]